VSETTVADEEVPKDDRDDEAEWEKSRPSLLILSFWVRAGFASTSTSKGVVPNTAPSLRVERTKRARSSLSRVLLMRGGVVMIIVAAIVKNLISFSRKNSRCTQCNSSAGEEVNKLKADGASRDVPGWVIIQRTMRV